MAGKILFINQGAEFMSDSLETNLKKTGMEVMVVPPDAIKVGTERFDTDIFVIYAGEYIPGARQMLESLRDYCAEEEKPICVVGYEKDVLALEHIIPPHTYACRMLRPFDVKFLVEKVEKIARIMEESSVKKRSILLVDDDPTYLKTVLKFLGNAYDVTAVRAGHHAIKYLETHHPDLILLDYEMPVMNGAETLEKIRAKPDTADIPIIFLTGMSDKETILEIMRHKPDGYLLKKMSKPELVASLKNCFLSLKWRSVR